MSSALAAQKVLIVDDEKDIRDLFARVLRDNGITVSTAAGGVEALARIPQEKPDLVILDLLMPEVSGEQVCQAIKTDAALRDTFIVILSCKDDLESKLHCLNLGAEEYLVKPIAVEEFAARINRLLNLIRRWSNHAPETSEVHDKTRPTVYLSGASGASNAAPATSVKQKEDQSKPQKHRARYGGYQIESIAGSGGMGHVYKARDESLDRYVAVKVLSKEWSESPEFLSRFRHEAKLIAAINHPRIAPIYTFGEEEGESYFALQWCSGGSLSNLLRREGNIELLRAVEMILQCAKGLEAAWSYGVVHRDIKPSNLMFDENQYIKIVDFGVAFREDITDRALESDIVVGSPSYMAPEQARGENTDHRTDIYSLGITFFQMLYGRLPYKAPNAIELIEKHSKAPFPPYDDLHGTIPLRAYQIIQKMTEKKPSARYESYADLIKDLEALRQQLYSQRRLKIPVAANLEHGPSSKSDGLFEMVASAFREEKTGLIKVKWNRLEKKFLIQHNEIIAFESTQADENFWKAMLSAGFIKPEKLPAPEEGLEESLNRLLFLNAFSSEDFKNVYKEIMMRSMLDVFRWPVAECSFYNARIEHDPFAIISVPAILLEASRIIPEEKVSSMVSHNQSISKTGAFNEVLDSLNLPRAEAFVVSRLEGENVTLQTLTWLTGLPEEQITRTVYLLERMGALEYRATTDRRPLRKSEQIVIPSETPVAVPQPPPNQPPPVVERPRENAQPAAQKMKLIEPPRRDVLRSGPADYKIAREKFETGKYWEVNRICAKGILENPNDHRYHHLMAKALAQFPHSLKAAEESFRLAIELSPMNIQYRLDLAFFLKDHGRPEAAAIECKAILNMEPQDREAKHLLAEIQDS